MISKEELLYTTLRNQYLLHKVEKAAVVSDLCGLQAQFANNPKYALRIRAADFDEKHWGDGLVKIWTFRGTLHAVRLDEVGLYLSAKGVPEGWNDMSWGLSKDIQPYWAEFIYEKVLAGVSDREELKRECRGKGMQQDTLEKVFHGWGGLLREMCDRGMIAYDIGTAKRFIACPAPVIIEKDKARAEIIKRYFKAFAPAAIADCAAFTGYKKREVLRLIEDRGIPLKSVVCEGTEYFQMDEPEAGEPRGGCKIPGCLFLAGFDQMIMGYKDRSRIMDEDDKQNIVTVSGIVHPTILLDGRVRAKWKKDGDKLVVTPFRPLSKKHRDSVISRGKKLFAGEVKNVVIAD